jgi:phenylalanyl-tRNA synthetase beta chain
MRVLLSWLGEHVDVPVEPKRLAEDLTLLGLAVDALDETDGDAILDLDITTNRVDCMNVYGVAREVSVLYDRPLRPLVVDFAESGPPAPESLRVTVEAEDLCPRFCGRVLDVRPGPSPAWVRHRLEAAGVRPISNLVDLTNYVMMEMGHPSHAFDLARVPKGELRVRWSREGEQLTTLDGVSRTLTGRVGVVAGPEAPLALAGIMGGASSEVSDETRVVALEAAYWNPLAIRRAAKGLGMHTEASHRFERGADPEGPQLATARLAHLLTKIGAGSARPGLIDRSSLGPGRRGTRLRSGKIQAVLGIDVPPAASDRILRGLGFAVLPAGAGEHSVEIPTWRGDVTREVDLVEEVARHYGIGRIPTTLPPAERLEGLRPGQRRERAARSYLVGAGLTEVINHSFVAAPSSALAPGAGPALANPLAEGQAVLRASLVIPGLLDSLRLNRRRGRRDVRVFEMGRVFLADGEQTREERRLAVLLAGAREPLHWGSRVRSADLFDAKGLVEGLLRRLGLGPAEYASTEAAPEFLHPRRSALVRSAGRAAGYLGALHPEVAEAAEARDEVIVAELDLDWILDGRPAPARVRPMPRFPASSRDLSIVCSSELSAEALLGSIRSTAGSLLESVALIDRYEGAQVPEGRVGVTVSLVFLDPDRTLTREEVQERVDAVVRTLGAMGAEIRGD